MSKKEYFAYGSNLNFEQMAYRCPEATAVGTARLDGYELAFRRGYLTILPKEGATVEGLIWSITDHDESQLDCYEGYPNFYYKQNIKLTCKGIRTGKRRTITAFAYIMHEERPIGIPSEFYLRTCLDGYKAFMFDKRVLINAYNKCRGIVENGG